MQEIRNAANRLVCLVDKSEKTVEIVIKDCKTVIRFLDNGAITVQNNKLSA